MMGNNSKVVLAALVAIVAMFIFMPAQEYLGAGAALGLEYRFIWAMGRIRDADTISLYQPHVLLLAVQIAAVIAMAGLQIAANRKN